MPSILDTYKALNKYISQMKKRKRKIDYGLKDLSIGIEEITKGSARH